MIYNIESKYGKNWVLGENNVKENWEYPAKYESVFCQGNGYMCVRASNEERCSSNVGAYTLVAGTYDCGENDDCTALPNLPDTVHFAMTVDGESVAFDNAKDGTYLRTLDLRSGLLERTFDFDAAGAEYNAHFRRVVSLADKHLAAAEIIISPKDHTKGFSFTADGGVLGSGYGGMGHFAEGVRSAADGVMQVVTYTKQSEIRISVTELVKYELEKDGVRTPVKAKETFDCTSASNCVKYAAQIDVPAGFSLIATKYVVIFTSRDQGGEMLGLSELSDLGAKRVKAAAGRPFDRVLAESAAEWERRIWSCRDVSIEGAPSADLDLLAYRFAIYHLTVMSPVHDNRMNIGAKGLSGPGYNGHAFWDTEIYMLPYFIFEAPEEARSLVEYRVNSLGACRRNAKKGGDRGARFCWESAWITDGEATPVWCDTGDLELHITADVALGAYYYYIASGDEAFMKNGGYELIFDTASFWASHMKLNEATGRFEIHDVTGPNEFHTHVDNNAYTNYLAANNLEAALKYEKHLAGRDPELHERLGGHIDVGLWQNALDKLYLPQPNEDGIIPEHDGFFDLPEIVFDGEESVSKNPKAWERTEKHGGVDKVQCSKQADVAALLYQMEDKFGADIKKKNFYFYERNCYHSSSLSLNTYSCLAADMGELDMAYELFERAMLIDMSNEPASSSAGIHAASLGGIWQCVVLGFGGVRRVGDDLRIEPHLPPAWTKLAFEISWKGQRLAVTETANGFTVENITVGDKTPVSFISGGSVYTVADKVEVAAK